MYLKPLVEHIRVINNGAFITLENIDNTSSANSGILKRLTSSASRTKIYRSKKIESANKSNGRSSCSRLPPNK